MPILTATAYKQYATLPSTLDDARITAAIAAAEAMLLRWTGADAFASTVYVDQAYSGNGSSMLVLHNWPVTAIASIAYVGCSGDASVLAASAYRADSSLGIVYKLGAGDRMIYYDSQPFIGGITDTSVWRAGPQNYTVSYTAGYATMPDDLVQLCCEMVDWIMAAAGKDPALQSESIGGYSYSRATQLFEKYAETWRNRAVRMRGITS